MKNGVICLGEALIDFIPTDRSNTAYKKSPGGAPANVAVGLSKLESESTFIGKLGNDSLGHYLYETLKNYQVHLEVSFTDEAKTAITLVELSKEGDRSFEFYINPSADQFLRPADIKEEFFKANKILHFGSISLIHEPSKIATKQAIDTAKRSGLLVSFDPNIRHRLWENDNHIKEEINSVLQEVDILKLSEEELSFLTSFSDIGRGIEELQKMNIPLIVVTLGDKGCWLVKGQHKIHVPAMCVNVLDTTAAGDAFVSGLLYCLNNFSGELKDIDVDQLKEMGTLSTVCGGLATTTKGAMSSLPYLNEVHSIVQES